MTIGAQLWVINMHSDFRPMKRQSRRRRGRE